ncbi:MAG: hypothetical protein A2583_03495 [Bdellovibrionales bacterium RIFOXYD1_FULL_53_11]|nr:MAG: hypothetical protein A2583_03495 [Bdellovibrionales bacterium RIFOXYD1_FULL_53_11]
MRVHGIIHSIQGESTLIGVRTAIVRLSGCNLRCRYCDTVTASRGRGREMSIPEILRAVKILGVKFALLTGGEPLLQKDAPALVRALRSRGFFVSVETNGETPIPPVILRNAHVVMDIKTPGSRIKRAADGRVLLKNLGILKKTDELKFVITSEKDYRWARAAVRAGIARGRTTLFSPAGRGPRQRRFARRLAGWIIRDKLDARLQLQLHKAIGIS